MPLREMNRDQAWLLPSTLNDLVRQAHPARFVASSWMHWTGRGGQKC